MVEILAEVTLSAGYLLILAILVAAVLEATKQEGSKDE